LTGFRKRKNKRRKVAEAEKQVKERQKRLQLRKERRAAMKLAQGNQGECDADEVLNEGEEVEIDDNENLKVSGEYLVSADFKFTFQCCKHSTSTPTSSLFTTIVITIIHLSIVLICLPLMPVI
jgi:hypothetical protein